MLLVVGPIQYEATVDPEIAKQKTHSEVAGQANVCIFPDLNTGNNTYKVGYILQKGFMFLHVVAILPATACMCYGDCHHDSFLLQSEYVMQH